MVEKGSWDNNQWFNPQGQFDWSAVDYLEFTAEHSAFGSAGIYLDQIGILAHLINIGKPESEPARELYLYGNFPNPFNPATNIRFYLPQSGMVNLNIYDLNGCRLITLLSADKPAGNHELRWNGRDESGNQAASGIYYYELIAAGKTLAGKMLLIR
jgi:hypothetical protein